MRRGGLILVGALALLISCSFGAQTASADEAATIYNPSTVFAIDLTLPKASEEELEAEPTDHYVEGTLTIGETEGTPGTVKSPPLVDGVTVGIRLKGSEGGSLRPLATGKSAFKVKCNFVSKSDRCLGLKKMTLNNMVQDPSMVHETLAYAAFGAAGVPAERTGFAYVRVNGNDFGVYLNVETPDDVFLEREFGEFHKHEQHLYEGEDGHDVKPGEAEDFEVDEGDEGPGSIGDLEALIEAVDAEPAEGESWSEHVAPYVDLPEMTKMWAVEKYIDHWDGYSGHTEAGLRPNNYYLYSETSGRFQMIPWGADQTWIPTIGVGMPWREVTFDGEGGVLFDKCVEDESCFRLYWEALNDVTSAIAALGPRALAESTAELLEPWQAEERSKAPTRAEFDEGEVEDGVNESLAFIDSRQEEAEDWLAANEPPELPAEEEEEGEGAEGGDGEAGGKQPSSSSAQLPTVTVPAPSGPVGPGVHVGRLSRLGRRLDVSLRLERPAAVAMQVTTGTRHGRRSACRTRIAPAAAGKVELRCRLSKAVLRRLRRHALPLRVTIEVTFVDGEVRRFSRRVGLRHADAR